MATTYEVEQYTLSLKRKIMISLATILVRFASKERKTAEEYTIEFQGLYLQYDDKVNPLLKQKLLTFLQENLMKKLHKTVPQQSYNSSSVISSESSNDTSVGNELFNLTPALDKNVRRKMKQLEKEIKDSTNRNIQFMKAIISLKTIVDKNPKISSSKLETLLLPNKDYECVNMSSTVFNNSISTNTDEDSGVFLTESYNSNPINFVSSNVLKFILHTSEVDKLLLQSAKCVIEVVEHEIEDQAEKYFRMWKGTLLEYAINVLAVLCCSNEECFNLVLQFICSMLENIWCNKEMKKHETIECQIHILGEFLSSKELCIELMKFISTKLESAITTEAGQFNSAEKSSQMLIFCSKLLDRFKILKLSCKQNTEDVEHNVASLWKQQYMDRDKSNDSKTVEDDEIKNLMCVLERLLICYSNIYPLLTIPVVKCLTCIKTLDKFSEQQ